MKKYLLIAYIKLQYWNMTKNIPNISKNNVKKFYGKIKLNSMFLD